MTLSSQIACYISNSSREGYFEACDLKCGDACQNVQSRGRTQRIQYAFQGKIERRYVYEKKNSCGMYGDVHGGSNGCHKPMGRWHDSVCSRRHQDDHGFCIRLYGSGSRSGGRFKDRRHHGAEGYSGQRCHNTADRTEGI